MSSNLWGPTSPVNQNQLHGEGPLSALQQEKFTGEVEHALMNNTVFEPHFKRRQLVKGTNTLTKKAIGRTKLQKLGRGQAPDGTQVKFGKAQVTVDTMVLSRHTFDELETIQTDIDARGEVAAQAGKDIGQFNDLTIMIAAANAAAMTANPYGLKEEDGFFGGTQVTIAAGDEKDPAKLYHAIGQMSLGMEQKNVNPRADKALLAVRPEQFYVLMDAEQIVNGEYVTASGTKLDSVPMFKTFGIPVISTTNIPKGVIEGHLLSNDDNGHFYDGDFTKLVALLVSEKALIIGESKALETKIWFSDESKVWTVDAWMSYGIGVDRPEYAARLDIA
ncbi:major capsid protein [Stenotrophomonas phage c9-N]|uniref:Major capsid protein n=1 Tax=Stenotrophomonas phage vB_SmeS_BUCT700 TaxID=2924895 RepID=A0AAE9GB92_9CAUD|nr:major capsid protein [Stenotrophomonas phage vB_SmeS_BUCT700]UNY50276.1 major capsid protein [Stenotrophomonas phage vB_SmeS_BUCT703]WKC56423.1 major capsid protein [Stenotrophomonas phage c9-N]